MTVPNESNLPEAATVLARTAGGSALAPLVNYLVTAS